MLDVDFVRSCFPALDSGWTLMDNAGGSVMPTAVIDRATDYMRRYQVQLGASYALSVEAAELVAAGRQAAAELVGADAGEVILGPSTTLNLELLSETLAPLLVPGDELVVTNLDHEANVGVWRRLAQRLGLTVREWRLRPDTAALELEDLAALLTDRTRWVCCTHCSNIAGEILDVAEIARLVHAAGARLCVDGVAFAPHRRVDVKELDVDVYAASLYKTYGPHLGLLYVRRELLETVGSRNHFFVDTEKAARLKLEPGNVNYELAASLPGILDYLEALDSHHFPAVGGARAERLERAFGLIAEHEERLAARLIEVLAARRDVRIVGPATADRAVRVPTVSFVVSGRRASDIPPHLDRRRIAIRWGHFYAYRPIRDLGLMNVDGVVRVSMVHYNTEAEVERLLEGLEEALAKS